MGSTLNKQPDHFFLEKWFLDFVTEEGEAFIFYAAKMRWHHIIVPYKSKLWYSPGKGSEHRTRFYNVHFPEIKNKSISWKDRAFKIEGTWLANNNPLKEQLFDSAEGGLQWNCFQPSSVTEVKIDNRVVKGFGYAECLELTVEPWKIPMDVLRWGRFVSEKNNLVWIQIKGENTKQWVWYNGEKITDAEVTDEKIILSSKNIWLEMSDSQTMGTKKNIKHVIEKLLRFIPGFKKSVPLNFLMADENKWISKSCVYKNGSPDDKGWVLHERVDFKS